MSESSENTAKPGSDPTTDQKKQDQHVLPKVTFSTFVLSMASAGLLHLGEVPDPENGQTRENLLLAKHNIDVLSMLQDKLENGLAQDEKSLLADLLYELRMKYVLKSK